MSAFLDLLPAGISFYAATLVAVVLLGFAKGGLAGAGLLATPLMTLVMPPFQAGAILLPILLLQDVVTVSAFHRSGDRNLLWRLVPAGIVGIIVAYVFAASISVAVVEAAIGVIAVASALLRLLTADKAPPAGNGRRITGWLAGFASGFSSQIAHAGAPPFQIYMLSRRLSTEVYLGTAAIYFAALDVAKVPAFLALGQLRAPDLAVAAVMAPIALLSSWAGVRVMRRLNSRTLYRLVSVMLLIVGSVLILRSFG